MKNSSSIQQDQPKLKKIKTRTTIVEHKEDEDLVYEKIKDSRFKQQRLPAWRPVPTIMSIILVFSIFGLIYIILGIIILVYSGKVHSTEKRYDDICTDLNENCNINITIDEDIDSPVFVYYQLDGFFQNSRRYVKSKNVEQLMGKTDSTENCDPVETNEKAGFLKSIEGNDLIASENAIPCGLMAKTFFNDSFIFSIDNVIIEVDISDMAFDKDKELYTQNLDKSKQWHDLTDPHFIVWMRPAGLPNPKKLWGKINRKLKKDEIINITISNNYNVSAYNGTKKIILSNATALGGKNKFLGISYIVVGALSLICAIFFPILNKIQLNKEKNS